MADSVTYRAAPSAYIGFGVICAGLALLGVVAAIISSMSWTPVLIPVGGYILVWVWLSRYRLVFSADHLSYQTVFASERAISYENIKSIAVASDTGAFESPYTVSVRSTGGEELRINAKVFPREAVQRLMAAKS
jgi:hypothetical protein